MSQRMELYRQGLSDQKLADRIGSTKWKVWSWRKENNLPPNRQKCKGHAIAKVAKDSAEHKKRMELYQQGLVDRQIAEKVGGSQTTIGAWRRFNRLPPNRARVEKATYADRYKRRTELYHQGLSDKQIAEIEGVTRAAISTWRHRNNPKHYDLRRTNNLKKLTSHEQQLAEHFINQLLKAYETAHESGHEHMFDVGQFMNAYRDISWGDQL